MGFKKNENRGKATGSRSGGWNPSHKFESREERERQRQDIETKSGSALTKIQQKFAKITTKDKQLDCIKEAVKLVFGFQGKSDQVESIWSLLVQREDRILVAKTGYGKSVVPQLLPLLVKNSIVLILLPLNALGAEQLGDIEKLPLAKPIWLHAGNNNLSTLQRIKAGIYTHILLSPEIACSIKFYDQVVSSSWFRSRLKAIIIDEVHLTVDWGQSFRKAYSLLKHFRNRLGGKPWFGCTATLNPDSFDELCRFTGFRKNVYIARTSIDRPEIVYIRKIIPTNQKMGFRYLHFLIEDAAEDAKPTPTRIPKSLLFFDRKDIMRKCIKTIRSWIVTKCGYSGKQAVDTVTGYHATLAERDKSRIYAEYKREDSKIRILCGTEAISTGLNVPDILRVVQVGMVRDGNVNILLQRLGRGGRKSQKALGIFFIDAKWASEGSEKLEKEHQVGRQKSTTRSKATRRRSVRGVFNAADDSTESPDLTENEGNAEEINSGGESSKTRKSNCPTIPSVLEEFCNTETRCLRNILLDHYQEPSHFRDSRDSSWCCSICNPELAILAEPPPDTTSKSKRGRPKGGKSHRAMMILIKGWCTHWATRRLPNAVFKPDYRLLISNDGLKEICEKAWLSPASTAEEIKDFLTEWKWGLQELESLWEAVLEARAVVYRIESTRQIQERLLDWPWWCIDVPELKRVLKEDDDGDVPDGVPDEDSGISS